MRRLGQTLAIASILLFFSPHWVPLDPWLVRGMMAALFLAGLTIAVVGAILGSLPENACMTPITDDDVAEACVPVVAAIGVLGFARLGPALRVHLEPEASIVPLWNGAERIYATVFVSDGQPGRAHYDFVTVFGNDVGLTSAANPAAGVLPPSRGAFLQIFKDAEPATLLARHREACDHLARAAGVRPEPLAPSFPDLLAAALRRQRHAFLKAPVRHAWTALGRVLTKSTPFAGPLAGQAATQARIETLAFGHADEVLAAR